LGRRRSRSIVVLSVTACAVALGVAAAWGTHSSSRALSHTRTIESCGCAHGSAGTSGETVNNVVDRRQVLRMPEYDARLLGSSITPTRVQNAGQESLYPGGRGELVSYEIRITNTSAAPLLFGAGIGRQPTPSYPRQSLLGLALPSSPGRGSLDEEFPAILNARGAPGPAIFQAQPIAPGATLTGWASFIAPANAWSLVHARPADMDFWRTNNDQHYVGMIRLWK
jgi:hypothetical protein